MQEAREFWREGFGSPSAEAGAVTRPWPWVRLLTETRASEGRERERGKESWECFPFLAKEEPLRKLEKNYFLLQEYMTNIVYRDHFKKKGDGDVKFSQGNIVTNTE